MTVAVDFPGLVDDLAAEHAALDELVRRLDDPAWTRPTPAPGWTVRDQIGHLAYYDEAAALAARDPDAFRRDDASIPRASREARQLARGHALSAPALLAWWRGARAAMLAAFRALDPAARLPWYGPSMGAVSFVTARLEETWGHGQDSPTRWAWGGRTRTASGTSRTSA